MRKKRMRKIDGNCCCLIPLLILVALACAALVGVAIVGNATFPDMLRHVSAHHRSKAWDDGYKEGEKLGAKFAAQADPMPSAPDLNALADRQAEKEHVTHDRARWLRGFKSGFGHGFKDVNEETSDEDWE